MRRKIKQTENEIHEAIGTNDTIESIEGNVELKQGILFIKQKT